QSTGFRAPPGAQAPRGRPRRGPPLRGARRPRSSVGPRGRLVRPSPARGRPRVRGASRVGGPPPGGRLVSGDLRFADRREAGRALGDALRRRLFGRGDVVVLGLPRGGIPVAYEVARAP